MENSNTYTNKEILFGFRRELLSINSELNEIDWLLLFDGKEPIHIKKCFYDLEKDTTGKDIFIINYVLKNDTKYKFLITKNYNNGYKVKLDRCLKDAKQTLVNMDNVKKDRLSCLLNSVLDCKYNFKSSDRRVSLSLNGACIFDCGSNRFINYINNYDNIRIASSTESLSQEIIMYLLNEEYEKNKLSSVDSGILEEIKEDKDVVIYGNDLLTNFETFDIKEEDTRYVLVRKRP